MGNNHKPFVSHIFFHGDGEMSARIRAFDWAQNLLGPIDSWPQALLTLTSVILGSHQPMFIVWGPERILLYNDAYAPIMSHRHPGALGRPFLDVWFEVRDDVKPIIDRAYAGEPIHMDDIQLMIERNGRLEERHFAFSYTPIRGTDGAVEGMICACTETTEKIFAERRIAAETTRMREMFQKAPGFMAMLRGPEHIFEFVNDAYMQLVGHRDIVGLPVRQALPEVEGQGFFELLDNVYRTGEAFKGHDMQAILQKTPGAAPVTCFIDLVYQPIIAANGEVTGIFVEGYDVSERVSSEAALRGSEERWRGLFTRMGEGFFIGEILYDESRKPIDFRFIETNDAFLTLTGLTEKADGKTVREAIPGIQEELIETYASVVETVQPLNFELHVPALKNRWFDVRANPTADARFSVLFLEITERKKAESRRTALMQLESQVRDLQTTAEIAYTVSKILGQELGAIRAGYASISAGDETVTIARDWVKEGSDSIAGIHNLRRYGSFVENLKRGELLVVDDVKTDPRTTNKKDNLKGIQVASLINIPYMKEGRLSAIIYIHDDVPRVWQKAEIDFVREVGIITWSTAERLEAEEAKRESESRYKLLSEMSSPQIMWSSNPAGNLTFAGQQWLDYSGMTLDETLGSGWSRAIHPDEFDHVLQVWLNALSNHTPYFVEMRLRAHDGTYRWFDTRANPVFGPDGAVIEWKGILLDIDDRKRTTDDIREAREHLRLMVESAADFAILSLDLQGIIVSWNPGAERIFGFKASAVIGQPGDIIFTPEDRADGIPQKEIDTAAMEGRAVDERWHLRADNSRFFASGIMTAMKDGNGALIGFTKIARDVTAQKFAEEELVKARNDAETANIAKSEFLANMSHEIRTPMNAIMGLSHILGMSQPLTQKQRDFIKTLQLSADSLLSLINDLLDIAKIEARTVELEKIPFDLTQLVQEIISMMAMQVKEKGLSFTMEGECVKHSMFLGDPTRIRQIILNLCSNAIKFTHNGGVHISITCHGSEQPEMEKICIKVTDTGIGIAPDKLETIFHKFVQADTSINRKYGGTGLGLAITKTLAEIMGGTINVESTLDKGSSFTVCIDLPIARNEIDNSTVNPALAAINDKSAFRSCVLIVDDYAPNVLVAASFLENFGYSHEIAINGLEAIEKVKSGHFSLILMDVQMHGMNGLEATSHIREHEKRYNKPRIPIIGMTAHALSGDRERCLASGMDDYISKPFNPEDLRTKIKEVIKF